MAKGKRTLLKKEAKKYRAPKPKKHEGKYDAQIEVSAFESQMFNSAVNDLAEKSSKLIDENSDIIKKLPWYDKDHLQFTINVLQYIFTDPDYLKEQGICYLK